jgi:Cyclic nucleotide-binding domain
VVAGSHRRAEECLEFANNRHVRAGRAAAQRVLNTRTLAHCTNRSQQPALAHASDCSCVACEAGWGNEARWLRNMGNREGTGMTTQSEFTRDEVLFHQGSAANCVLRIVAGEVEVLRELDGASVLLGHARAGEWLGEMAAIEARIHSATARAVTDGAVEMLTTVPGSDHPRPRVGARCDPTPQQQTAIG